MVERLLVLVGTACSLWVAVGVWDATALRRSLRDGARELAVDTRQPAGLFAKLDIPALHLSLPVVEGTDYVSLRRAVGHIPGTAVPGGLGNVGLAGHRDTFFRPLRQITKNTEILLANHEGVYHYSVTSTEIVSPDAVRVLDISSTPELTLITCFPFDYVGSAPRRFVVHARLLSADGKAASLK